MTSSTARSPRSKRIAATCAILGLATIGIAAAPQPANAWWRGGYGYGYQQSSTDTTEATPDRGAPIDGGGVPCVN